MRPWEQASMKCYSKYKYFILWSSCPVVLVVLIDNRHCAVIHDGEGAGDADIRIVSVHQSISILFVVTVFVCHLTYHITEMLKEKLKLIYRSICFHSSWDPLITLVTGYNWKVSHYCANKTLFGTYLSISVDMPCNKDYDLKVFLNSKAIIDFNRRGNSAWLNTINIVSSITQWIIAIRV